MKEYAFDVKLWAVVRVQAKNEPEARKKMCRALNCFSVDYDHDGVAVTEVSIEDESGETSELIEVDGEDC